MAVVNHRNHPTYSWWLQDDDHYVHFGCQAVPDALQDHFEDWVFQSRFSADDCRGMAEKFNHHADLLDQRLKPKETP